MQTTLLLATVVFFAAVVRGYTGFALSAIVITTMSHWIPARELVPMLVLLEFSSSVLFVRNIFKQIEWRTIAFIIAGSACSAPIAIQLLIFLPSEITHIVIATLVMIATCIVLSGVSMRITPGAKIWFATGVAMGFCGGLGSIGGLAGMVILLSTTIDAAKARATMITLLLFTSVYNAFLSTINGLMTTDVLNRLAIVFIPMLAGLYIGYLCFNHYGRSLRTATLVLLGILSATMLLQSIWPFIT